MKEKGIQVEFYLFLKYYDVAAINPLSTYFYKLASEPSVAKGTHSYSRRLPALGCKFRF